MTADPVAEIVAMRDEARRRQDVHVDVCFLVTTGERGRPEARPVSLRDVDADGFGLLLNTHSPKWRRSRRAGAR
jgi:Pyridoxamine-phosphate oxidase